MPSFDERAGRWRPVLHAALAELYRERVDVEAYVADLVDDLRRFEAARDPRLRALDRAREADPAWFQSPRLVGYVAYTDRFAGTLAGVRERLDYLDELGVTYLHLMPVLRPRPGESDGGYAVADYDDVDPRLGSMADLTALAHDLHARDMALCVDLVLNHTAREHAWAQAALAGDPHFRAFYLTFPDRTLPDAYEQTVPDIFPALAPGSFTFVPELDRWVWTTFREFQWDLDYANPDVFRAMVGVLLRLANRGPDVLRLDAAPFLWKQLGTDCQNRPQTHRLLEAFRAAVAIAAPGVLLKAEAMVPPEVLPSYLGVHGDELRPECHIAYDNQLMVLLWSMLATGRGELARHALARRRPAPPGTSYATFLRSHDDIGWAVSDADAAAAGLDGAAHRRFLSEFYAGTVPGSFARGAVFQPAASGAAPISGTAASLCGIQAALEGGDGSTDGTGSTGGTGSAAGALALAVARLESLYSVVFGYGGIPLVFSGDELAQRNDAAWAERPGQHGDNRWLHRPPLDPDAAARRATDGTLEQRVFSALQRLARVRAALPALGADAHTDRPDLGEALFAYRRTSSGSAPVLGVVNLAAAEQSLAGVTGRLCAGTPATANDSGTMLTNQVLRLPPFGYAWVVETADAITEPR